VANQGSFQRSEELSILRPRTAGTALPCVASTEFKRAGVSGESTSRLLEEPCYARSKSDDVQVEFTPWCMSQSQFRYRGEPNVIDLGEL
jgi:hypothetical protein